MPPMTDTVQMHLTDENRDFLKRKLESGEFRSESDVVNSSMDLAREDEDQLNHWIRTVCVPIAERMSREQDPGIPAEEVLRHIELRRQKQTT